MTCPLQAFAAVPETDRHPVKMAAGSSGGAGAYKSAPPQPSDDDLNSLVDSILSGPHEAAAPTREPRQIPTGYVPSTAQETDAAKIWQSGDADLADLADSLLAEVCRICGLGVYVGRDRAGEQGGRVRVGRGPSKIAERAGGGGLERLSEGSE